MVIVSDTSIITNLHQVGQLSLLKLLFNEVIIPDAVYQELIAMPLQKKVVDESDWIIIKKMNTEEIYIKLLDSLDPGESEAIALAIELQADALLMDEKKGRKAATAYGIDVTGILGVLLEAKAEGFLESVKPIMDALIYNADFRIAPNLYKSILKKAEE